MSNSLRVINRGLVRLGVPPLASLSSADAQAIVAETLYEEVKRAALADFPWSFALRETDLPKLALPTSQEPRWEQREYTYQLPNDVVRVLGLISGDNYRLTGDQLHTEDKEARLVYVADVGEQHWPEFFQKAVAFEFASAAAISLTEDARRAELMYEEKREALRRARAIDSQQTPHTVISLMKVYQKRTFNPLQGA